MAIYDDPSPDSAPVRVMVVDDQSSFRQAARELLEFRGYAVVGEAAGAVQAIDAVAHLAPDAVLLDVRLGEASGFDVSRSLTRAHPALAVLLVSAEPVLAQCQTLARSSGAVGLVLKSRLPAMDLAEYWPSSRTDARS